MDDKELKNTAHIEEEKILEFAAAKDLTIAEAVKKHQEIKAGITEEDGVLDRYIKQHRQDIESQKFETATMQLSIDEEPLIEEEEQEEVTSYQEEATEIFEEPGVIPETPIMEEVPLDTVVEKEIQELEFDVEEVHQEEKRKLLFVWSGLALALIAIVVTAFVWLNNQNQSTKQETASTSSSSSTQISASSSEDSNLLAFKQLYATFFTDSSLTKLKNSEFGKLSELETLLGKIDSSSKEYQATKEQYEQLKKAIDAIQSLNNQFDKPVITNGEIDTNVTAKAGVSFTAVTTGISSVDSLLASAVNFGRSQQEKANAEASSTAQSSAATTGTNNETNVAETNGSSSSVEGDVTSQGSGYSTGTLQRELSRVPYNQAKIDDTNNEAWVFGPGILENIISISQQRGYITGDNYIIEKVNIINGNGYYNLFKTDGTYLFSINCKTGYFVGNGAGHSDALDY